MPRLVFAGTPEFAAEPLRALLQAWVEVTAVYTQPDRPAGRGRKLSPSPVKQVALAHDLPVFQPRSLRDVEAQAQLQALQPDVFLVIAYGLILPQRVLDIPRLGCVNLHASLLPRWRGAAPIQRAIEAGDEETGLCLMQMEAGLDTGPVLAQANCAIEPQMTAGQVHDALVELGAAHLPQWMQQYCAGQLQAQPQDDAQANYAHKLEKSESRLDWTTSAAELARKLRAFDPWPGSSGQLDTQAVKLFGLRAVDEHAQGQPGEIVKISDEGLEIACGQGSLTVAEVQFPGARRMPAQAAARGRQLMGQRFV